MLVAANDTAYELFVAIPFVLAMLIGVAIVVWFVRAARRDREEQRRADGGNDS